LGGSAPVVSPTGDDSLEFGTPGTYTSNNDLGTFGVYNTTFDAGNGTTTLTGGEIDLSWPLSENNNPAFANNSTNPVTINNNVVFSAPPDVGGTQEYFVLAPGSTTTFNGSVTLTGGSSLKMTNGEATSNLGGPGGTMIWTQPVTFTNSPNDGYSGYFPFRIYEGTLEMGGYTIDNGISDAPVVNIGGVNIIPSGGGVNNGAITDMYLGPEDRYTTYPGTTLLHPNDVVSFYLIAGGNSFNQPVQIGDAGTITIGGVNTSGTVTFNDFFKTLPTDGNGIINGQSQMIYFSAAAGGTVLQNFALIRGGGSGYCGASVDKIGPGTWIVAGGGDNNTGEQAYYGTTTVRDGTLELAYDDTGTNYVNFSSAVLSAGAPYYQSGNNGGSLGYNAPTSSNVQLDTNAVQLGDSGTLSTDNIALLTLADGSSGPRQVLHNISVNNDNPSGTTSIGVADNGTANFTGNILLYKSVVLASGTGGVANFSGNVTGTGAITVNGTGTVNLSGVNAYNGATNVNSGAALVIAAAGALPTGTTIVNNGSLTVNGSVVTGNISGTGTLNIGVASTTVLKLASGTLGSSQGALNISPGSTLDIANNHLYIYYGSGSDPISTIAGYIKSGYNGGNWNGLGIDTSAPLSVNGLKYALGYADGKDGKVAGLSSGQIEVAYTLAGDANLDGFVNGEDFTILASNFNQNVTGWDQGDFNYDGTVNGEDFTLLAANFNQGASGADASAGDFAALDAFAAANGITLPTTSSSVPEPGTAALVCMVGAGLLHRRRRA
jgi:autotransporter-associated beta strand protein